ncbi:FadR/GntR family transcriptional regulator [Jiangella asiatica]|uniref:FadR family transcriptional regulator n=1 Tax=Jiangella asiatica TaxID=2530372 RepID=A0A4R5DLF7_9ACTN|nr:FadR/GntR family transcriptional regulator [Jiangella asiatica]TDE11473.1 FadR family transcriptional regulator [Jiangella asiatica]
MGAQSRRGMHGIAVDGIGSRIVSGELAPGQTLDVAYLEREYDASRTVIREAMRVLAAKGMVDARPKRGTYVLPREAWSLLDPDLLRWQFQEPGDETFLQDLAEVREIVEPAGARLAARRRGEDELEVMRETLALLDDTTADPVDVVEADLRFHRTLLHASHNELLRRLELVIETGLRARDVLVHGRGTWKESVSAHRAVLDAVAAGDPDTAETAMRRLLDQAARDVQVKVDGDPR